MRSPKFFFVFFSFLYLISLTQKKNKFYEKIAYSFQLSCLQHFISLRFVFFLLLFWSVLERRAFCWSVTSSFIPL